MSSLCFCNHWGGDDFVCLCFDSGEESDEEAESVDDNIDGGGTEMGGENVGIEIPCTVTQSCLTTAETGSYDTGNTTVGQVVIGEIENGNLRVTELGNDILENGDLMKTNLRGYNKKSKSVGKIWRVSCSLTSFAAKQLREETRSVLKHDSTSDQLPFLNSDSIANKKQCHFNEDMAKSDSSSSTEYEWQYQEEGGSWVSYDASNATGGLQSIPKSNTTMSQNIERYHKSRLIPNPIFFRKNNRRCVLDLQSMTEFDTEDGTDRPIRRVLNVTPKITCEKISVAGNGVSTNNAASRGMAFLPSSAPEINKDVEVDLCSALPSYLTPMQGEAPFITEALDTSCAEDENLVTLVKLSPPMIITQTIRIQILEHFRAYEKRRACLELQFPDFHHGEEVLIHGTKSENVESFCKENFNWRLYGKANGPALGRGV